jgi:hypothetical protein
MSIEIRDTDGGLGNIITCRDVVQEEEYIDAIKKHLTQDAKKFRKYRYSLTDLTATTDFDLSTEAVNQVVEYNYTASLVNPDAIVAVAAKQELVFGLARMWEMLSYKTPWEKKIFRNRDEAEAWIRERVKEKYGIEDLTFS